MNSMKLMMLLFAISMLIPFASANDSPYANINKVGSAEIIDSVVINVCEELVLSGRRSSDPDGSVEEYHWYDGDKLLSEEVTLILEITDTSTKSIKLVVTDNKGKTDETIVKVYSHLTPDPKISLSNPNGVLYQTDEFMVIAIVPKNGNEFQKLDLKWDYDEEIVKKVKENKRIRKDGEEYQLTFKALKPGNTKISFSGTNLCGETAEEEVNVKISSSKSPKIEEIIIPEGIREEERFEISAEVSDCNGCQYLFEVFNSEYPGSEAISTSETEKICLTLDYGLYHVNLTVKNKEGISAFKWDIFEVPNTKNDKPVADASKTAKYAVIDTAFTLDASKSRDDGKISYCQFFLLNTNRNKYEQIYEGNSLICEYSFTRSGLQKLFVLVRDDAFPSLESKPYPFQVIVVDSEKQKKKVVKTEEVKKQPKVVIPYQPPSEEELKDRRNKELARIYLPGFEFPLTFLVIIIIARKSRRDL